MTTSINNFFGKSIPYLLAANVFFLPINIKIAIPFIPVLAFAWLLSGDWLDVVKKIKGNVLIILLASFWMLHLIGLFYSKNYSYGILDLQQKLSFFVFPLIFISSAHRIIIFKKWLLWAFVAGCFASGIYLLANAFFMSFSVVYNDVVIFNPIPVDAVWQSYFRYSSFSVFHHTSYLAMYFSFTIAILFQHIVKNRNANTVFISIVGIAFMFFLIVLLSSRAGILVGTLTLVAGVFWLFYEKYKFQIITASAVFVAISIYLFVSYNQRIAGFNDDIQSVIENKESSTELSPTADMRVQIWSSIPSILGKSWLFGFGTGDSKDELLKGYSRLELNNLLEREYNAHNQYLESLLALGIPGISVLLVMLFYPIFLFLKGKVDFLPIIFLGIVIINLLFESMLVRIAGVMFFSIYYCLLFLKTDDREIEENNIIQFYR